MEKRNSTLFIIKEIFSWIFMFFIFLAVMTVLMQILGYLFIFLFTVALIAIPIVLLILYCKSAKKS